MAVGQLRRRASGQRWRWPLEHIRSAPLHHIAGHNGAWCQRRGWAWPAKTAATTTEAHALKALHAIRVAHLSLKDRQSGMGGVRVIRPVSEKMGNPLWHRN